MTLRPLLFLAAALGLAACGGEPVRISVPEVAPQVRAVPTYRRVEVREVQLPTYASFEEIAVAQEDGTLKADDEILWADDPVRDVTLALASDLAQITGANVAPEPWPFRNFPDATLDVRIKEMIAGADGQFRMSGQYFVAPEDPDAPEFARGFEFAVPYAPAGNYGAIAAARGAAITELATRIAKDGL